MPLGPHSDVEPAAPGRAIDRALNVELVGRALEDGERKFLIDFSRTGYIDSSGLGALVSVSKKVREDGGQLRLAGLNEDLRSLFELTKLDTLFAISETPDQALATF